MNISVEYHSARKPYGYYNEHEAKFHVGEYELDARALYANVCNKWDNYNGKAPYSILHPYPYYLSVSFPLDTEERKAIYNFLSANQERIKQDYGLVFEFEKVTGDLSAYKKECDILGVGTMASPKDILTKFRELSLKWHPDRWTTATEEERKTAEENFKKISSAYEKLKDIDTEDVEPFFFITDLWQKSRHEDYNRQVVEEKKKRITSLSF